MDSFKTPVGPAEKFQMALVRWQKKPGVGPVMRMLAKFRGIQIPPHTYVTPPYIAHVGPIIVHEKTVLGRDVTLFHNVTIGRGNIWEEPDEDFGGFVIEDNAVICAGAVILGTRGRIVVGEGSVVGANAVLTQSTGAWEVWAGAPARRVGTRSPLENRP